MKHIKKIAALVLALTMVLSISVVAFADDNTTGDVYNGSNNSAATGVAGTTQIPLKKAIVFFNIDGKNVYEPNITYTYTVAPFDPAGATVTDADSDQITVLAGPIGGVYFATDREKIAFSSSNPIVAAEANGVEVEHGTELSVKLDEFDHAGVYRYIITETTDAADIAAKGIERGTEYDPIRYLDVYIGRKIVSGSGTDAVYGDLELKGAVIFKTVKDSDDSNNGKDSITTTTEKTTGFEPSTPAASSGNTDYTNDQNVDRYTTYNFTVEKKTTGTLADTLNEFPFYVNVTNSISGAAFTYTKDGSETFTGFTVSGDKATLSTADFAIGSDGQGSTLTLKNNDKIVLVGVPTSLEASTPLSVVVKEWNNTVDQYTASVKAANGTVTLASYNKNEGSWTKTTDGVLKANTTDNAYAVFAKEITDSAVTAFDVKTNEVAEQKITVTNNLSEVSPTGYVVRIAPYVLMLAGGVALLVVTRRRRREDSQAA